MKYIFIYIKKEKKNIFKRKAHKRIHIHNDSKINYVLRIRNKQKNNYNFNKIIIIITHNNKKKYNKIKL